MQKVDVRLEDDLTGGPADETVHFGVDGRAYEIDLNAKHAASFRNLLGPFVERARLARARRPRTTIRTTASRERSREIRAWAEQHGFAVAEHGRLPRNVIEEYDRASSGEQPTEHRGRQPSARRRSADHPSSKPDRGAHRASRRRAPRAG
jgi:Lsr2